MPGDVSASDVVSYILQLASQHEIPIATEGDVVPGSYDPTDGTIEIQDGFAATLTTGADPGEQAIVHERVPLLTNHVGDQGGPIGGERCLIIPVAGGKAALLYHGPDDSPNAPAGEKHIYLRNADQSVATKAYLKVQVDATRLGHQRKVTFLAPVVVLGADSSSDDLSIVRKKDLMQFKRDIISSVQQALNQGFQTVAAGSGVPPPTVQDINVQASQTGFSA